MRFLFDPDQVARRLAALPAIRARLPLPSDEGASASALPEGTRKSNREIYRLLANARMPHLRPALLAVENAVAAEVDLPELFSLEQHSQFSSHLAEAIAADHFLLKGFGVEKIARGGSRSADFVVRNGDLDATVEIYSPREWDELANWETALWDTVKNLDVPQVYRASVNTVAGLGLDPWSLARGLKNSATRVLAEIEADAVEFFASGALAFNRAYDHEIYSLETTVEVEVIAPSGSYHDRLIFQGGASITGYAPEGMFNRLVQRKVWKKAVRGQAQAGTTRLRGLIVDLQRSHIADDLRQEPYRTMANDAVGKIDLGKLGLDFVAFGGRAFRHGGRPRRGLFIDNVVFENTKLSEEQMKRLLWPPG